MGADDVRMSMTETSGTQPAILAEHLVRRFDGLNAVDGLDLEIKRGEINGFLGPNGTGKSTTVRVLCTLLAPTDGRAMVAGYDVATQPDKVRLHAAGQRSLVTGGWQWARLAEALLAIAGVGLVSMSLGLAALRGRTKRG